MPEPGHFCPHGAELLAVAFSVYPSLQRSPQRRKKGEGGKEKGERDGVVVEYCRASGPPRLQAPEIKHRDRVSIVAIRFVFIKHKEGTAERREPPPLPPQETAGKSLWVWLGHAGFSQTEANFKLSCRHWSPPSFRVRW